MREEVKTNKIKFILSIVLIISCFLPLAKCHDPEEIKSNFEVTKQSNNISKPAKGNEIYIIPKSLDKEELKNYFEDNFIIFVPTKNYKEIEKSYLQKHRIRNENLSFIDNVKIQILYFYNHIFNDYSMAYLLYSFPSNLIVLLYFIPLLTLLFLDKFIKTRILLNIFALKGILFFIFLKAILLPILLIGGLFGIISAIILLLIYIYEAFIVMKSYYLRRRMHN